MTGDNLFRMSTGSHLFGHKLSCYLRPRCGLHEKSCIASTREKSGLGWSLNCIPILPKTTIYAQDEPKTRYPSLGRNRNVHCNRSSYTENSSSVGRLQTKLTRRMIMLTFDLAESSNAKRDSKAVAADNQGLIIHDDRHRGSLWRASAPSACTTLSILWATRNDLWAR